MDKKRCVPQLLEKMSIAWQNGAESVWLYTIPDLTTPGFLPSEQRFADISDIQLRKTPN
jgi:hypothetical protein